jgi:hypothetical protein
MSRPLFAKKGIQTHARLASSLLHTKRGRGLQPARFLCGMRLTNLEAEKPPTELEQEQELELLCHLLENKGHGEGQNAEVQRVFPTHYMSSWIDLPYTIANLRFVPEMLVALLAQQTEEQFVKTSVSSTRFSVNRGFQDNILLQIFGKGVSIEGAFSSSMTSDKVDENESFGIDQLLAIRLAQVCGEAPGKLYGMGEGPTIPNSWSVARVAAEHLREDLSILLQAYGQSIPRQTLVPMLESVIGLGLLNVFLSCLASALHWQKTGTLLPKDKQASWAIFVDASNGADHQLRRLSEDCRGL